MAGRNPCTLTIGSTPEVRDRIDAIAGKLGMVRSELLRVWVASISERAVAELLCERLLQGEAPATQRPRPRVVS